MSEKDNLDDVQQTLIIGINGPPILKEEERNLYLGEFKERVLFSLTKNEVAQKVTNKKVEAAMEDPRSSTVIVHNQIPYRHYQKYRILAEAHNLEFTVRYDPDFKGDLGLVVVSDNAIE